MGEGHVKTNIQTQTQKNDKNRGKKHHRKMEAEVGSDTLQVKEHQGLQAMPEVKRTAWDRFSPYSLQGEQDVARILIWDF